MAKKKCGSCGEEEAIAKVTKGSDKGLLLCEDCLSDWKDYTVDEMYEDL